MDRDHLAAFAREHEAALLRYAFLLTGSRAEAEDLVQGSLLRLLGQNDTAVIHPLAYVRRMVYHQHCSVVRRVLPSKLLASARLDTSPAFESEVVERSWMWAELDRLPRRQRTEPAHSRTGARFSLFEPLDRLEPPERGARPCPMPRARPAGPSRS